MSTHNIFSWRNKKKYIMWVTLLSGAVENMYNTHSTFIKIKHNKMRSHKLCCNVRKHIFEHVCPVTIQIRLCIHPLIRIFVGRILDSL